MSDITIPPPHPDLIESARSGVKFRAELYNFDLSSEEGQGFLDSVTDNIAQLNAEIFWLRGIIHSGKVL